MKKWIALVVTLLMVGCSKQESQTPTAAEPSVKRKVVVYNWTEYLPDSALQAFTKETGIEVEYATYESNEAMYAKIKLLDGKGYDVVVPSTFYVEKMRKEGLLQKLEKEKIQNIANLDPALLNKSYDPNNEYSVPYLVSATGIAINGKVVDASKITKWADLWKPEYVGKIELMDDMRDNFYIGLRLCGFQDNSTNEAEIKCAYEKLKELLPSVKTFNSDAPKVPLIQGNVSIGAIWNGEAYKASQELENVQFVYPEEGATFAIDSFVIPKGAADVDAAYKFIDFMLRAESAKAAIEDLGYTAPNLAGQALLDEKLRSNKMVFPSKEDFEKGSIHADVGDEVLAIYSKYWDLLKAGQ
ncbi:MAG: extracellular solute-binding protein [Gammaproteobacteria bacterium]|nr:MAG: extracellular solute-binding protein [Gammaproteobacteria bacterium]